MLITGAARGIGLATASRLSARGANLALVGLEPELLEQLASQLGDGAAWFEADVTDGAALQRAVDGTVHRFGGIDVAIANAGVMFVEPLSGAERRAISEAPAYDDELRAQLGLARTEGAGKSLLELINLPSLNINGVSSGDVGTLARNVIPTTAAAVLDLRLVKGNDYRRQVQYLQEHIRKQGFYVIERDPTDDERRQHALIAKVMARSGGYNAERTRMDLPISVAVIAAVQSTSPEPIVKLPTSGGSLPLSIITDHLRTVTMTVPIVNYDNNQHAENENIRLQNLWDGIETMAAVMTMKPKF